MFALIKSPIQLIILAIQWTLLKIVSGSMAEPFKKVLLWSFDRCVAFEKEKFHTQYILDIHLWLKGKIANLLSTFVDRKQSKSGHARAEKSIDELYKKHDELRASVENLEKRFNDHLIM
jgi:hypothetical protein